MKTDKPFAEDGIGGCQEKMPVVQNALTAFSPIEGGGIFSWIISSDIFS